MGTIRKYFGSHWHLYEVLDYKPEKFHIQRLDQIRRSVRLRRTLCDQLITLFRDNIEIFVSRERRTFRRKQESSAVLRLLQNSLNLLGAEKEHIDLSA